MRKRTDEQKLDCIKRAISNAQEHMRANDPRSVYSQYVRYALHEVSDLNFYTSIEAKGLKRKEVIHEHVVPHGLLLEKLLSLNSLTNENIMAVLQKYYVICKITKEEDKRLNSAGFRSKMPEGWADNDSVFARYEKVGILIDNGQE